MFNPAGSSFMALQFIALKIFYLKLSTSEVWIKLVSSILVLFILVHSFALLSGVGRNFQIRPNTVFCVHFCFFIEKIKRERNSL